MTGVIAPTEEARFGDFTVDGRAYSRMTHRQDGDAVVPLSETERNEQAQLYAMATPNYEEQTVTDLTPQEASAVRAAWLDAPTHNWDNMFHVDPATGLLPSSSQDDELAAAMNRHPSGKIPPLKPVTRLASVPRH